MSITVNLYYTGKDGNAKKFVQEMNERGIVERIRQEPGNLKYEYFQPLDDPETILLIDSWKDQKSIDDHHKSSMMKDLATLREKYDLHMKVERYISENLPNQDKKFIRK